MIAVSKFACHFLYNNVHHLNIFHLRWWTRDVLTTEPPVMDVSAPTTRKGAAKCEKHCELQDSVNQLKVERMLLFGLTPESMFASVSFVSLGGVSLRFHMFSCFNVAFVALTHVSWWCWTCATLNIFFGSGVTCDPAAPVCIFTS